MEENKGVTPDSPPAQDVPPQEEPVKEDEKIPTSDPANNPEEKTVPYSRFQEVVQENKKLKGQPPTVINKNLDVNDFISISTSLEGLDNREKEYVANQHKLSGKPIKDIRSSEDFLLWQSAYRTKIEKENKTIIPSGKQPDTDAPISLEEALANATPEEKEKLLAEHMGYSFTPKSRADKVILQRG